MMWSQEMLQVTQNPFHSVASGLRGQPAVPMEMRETGQDANAGVGGGTWPWHFRVCNFLRGRNDDRIRL